MPPVLAALVYYGLTLTFEVGLSSLAVLLSANETKPGIIRSDASDCLYGKLMSFLNVRVQPLSTSIDRMLLTKAL